MKTNKKITSLAVLVISMITSAIAGEVNGSFQAAATLSPTCTVTGGAINFGGISLTNPNNSTGSINLLCSSGISYDIKFSEGSSTNQLQRTMLGSASSNTLKYNLYTDSSYTVIVGDGTNGTSHPLNGSTAGRPITNGISSGRDAYISNGRNIRWDVFANVPSSQYVNPDNYIDNLTVSIIY